MSLYSTEQTNAMTSCCSIANLTLGSSAPGADGKRKWARLSETNLDQMYSWRSWDGALADAGCSAGLEGQDPRGRSAGNLNWFNVSVCGPHALCMPHNPVAENKTRWAFACKCTFGQHVDPTSTGDGVWFPDAHCTMRNYKGWVDVISYALIAIVAFCILTFACDTLRRLMKRSSKGCWATKLTFELLGLIVLLAFIFSYYTLTVAGFVMEDHGISKRQLQSQVTRYFEAPILPLMMINTLFVAVAWVHVASNARAFRRTTSRSARRHARVFVGIMCAIQVVVTMVGWLTDRTFVALGTHVLLLVVLLTYLVGSCKVRSCEEGASVRAVATGQGISVCPHIMHTALLIIFTAVSDLTRVGIPHPPHSNTSAAGRHRGPNVRE